MMKAQKRLLLLLSAAVILLLVPLVAMQLTNNVSWTVFDFLVAGVLLLSAVLLCEVVFRKIKDITYRILIFVLLFLFSFLALVELAVGLLGTRWAGK